MGLQMTNVPVVPSISILSKGSESFQETLSKTRGKQIRFLQRTMVEQKMKRNQPPERCRWCTPSPPFPGPQMAEPCLEAVAGSIARSGVPVAVWDVLSRILWKHWLIGAQGVTGVPQKVGEPRSVCLGCFEKPCIAKKKSRRSSGCSIETATAVGSKRAYRKRQKTSCSLGAE